LPQHIGCTDSRLGLTAGTPPKQLLRYVWMLLPLPVKIGEVGHRQDFGRLRGGPPNNTPQAGHHPTPAQAAK
jgi:hypothetical protein